MTRRLLSAALVLLIAASCLPASAAVTTVTLFIPDRVEDLRLTPLPDIPPAPEYPLLETDLDQIQMGDPCPVVADPDGYMYLRFTPCVDWCTVDGVPVALDSSGCGKIPLASTQIQNIKIIADYGDATFYYYASGNHRECRAEYGNMTIWYDRYDYAYLARITESTDYFLSGQSCAAITNTYWQRNENLVVREGPGGTAVKDSDTVWYVSFVMTDYDEETDLYQITAYYLNDEKRSLDSYSITYNQNFTEIPYSYTTYVDGEPVERTGTVRKYQDQYLVSYSGRDYTSGSVDYAEDQILYAFYQDMGSTDVTVIAGTAMAGAVYRNASGKYFGSDRWLRVSDLTPYRGRKKLRKLSDFVSVRREEP